MTNCIDWVQKTYGEDQQVHVIYEDLPNNDFNTLIRYIEGVISGSRSYVKDHKNVFVTCCGRSFYKQCLPDASVHLGFSSLAVMWPSGSLNVTSQEVFPEHFAAGSPERREYETRAVSDWEMFLLHRAKELIPGGRLVIDILDETFCPCNKTTGEWCVLRAMTDIWREMAQEHIISEEEFLATTASSYRHSAGILSAPFHDKTSRVTKSGLQLVALETKRIKCTWRERWLMVTKHDDSATARIHAVSFVQSIRAWSNRVFATGLSNQRNVEERKKILDELYCRLVDEVAKAPADRGCSRVDDFVIVAKTGDV
ncbi:hypothetical protein LSAT2_002854 [Lamellibrachia satsuma]|nr:hypothetical protein LSAT2_002854 [Lamellibrachia satsuma]